MRKSCHPMYIFHPIKWCYVLILLPLISTSLAASDALTNRETEVKEQPALSANLIERLAKDTDVAILERNRGWYRVDTPTNNQGWVNMLQLRYKKAPRPNQDAKLLSFIGLRESTDNITATTGIRGIGKSDIRKSKPDFSAVQEMLGFTIDGQQAQAFAAEIKLKSNKIDYQEQNDE